MIDVKVHEVGMRDGLQMEKTSVPTETKIVWIKKLIESGVDFIQIGSFVNPEKMPQMGDTDDLFHYFSQNPIEKGNSVFSGLVLNERGLERAMNCGVDMVCMGVSASETHSMKNTGMTVADASTRTIKMAQETMKSGKLLQVSVQSAFGCGFEGAIDEEKVYSMVSRYLDAGIRSISLADTAGHAEPHKVHRMFSKILSMSDDIVITSHFHNTYGMGMANCIAAMDAGAQYFETAFGGLGGCPFTKLAAGNVCTEDFVHFLHRINLRNDIALTPLIEVSRASSEFLGKELPGFVYKTGGIKY